MKLSETAILVTSAIKYTAINVMAMLKIMVIVTMGTAIIMRIILI